MTNNPDQITNPDQEATFSVVTVPEHLHQQVVDYVKQLMEQEADTSAYMLGLGGLNYGTKCIKTQGRDGHSFDCSDALVDS
jgi:hypothetical protein